tara:strand:+ start:758 stop:1513 length:756 start_codon:yes stop_codon:yes gene_type:complete
MITRRCECINYINGKRCKNKIRLYDKNKFRLYDNNKILDSNSKNNNNRKYYCLMHFNMVNTSKFYQDNAINIQKYYKGYKCRKTLNNIYRKLPCDIQRFIVDKYLRKDYFIKKFNNCVSKIINNKISQKINILEPLLQVNIANNVITGLLEYSEYNFINYIYNNDKEFIYIYNLYNKYRSGIKGNIALKLKQILSEYRYLIREIHRDLMNTTMYVINNDSFEYYVKLKNIYYTCDAYLYPYNYITNNYGMI